MLMQILLLLLLLLLLVVVIVHEQFILLSIHTSGTRKYLVSKLSALLMRKSLFLEI